MGMHAPRPARCPPVAGGDAPVEAAEAPALSVESLYRQHGASVLRWAELLLGPVGDPGDVAHDVFMVVQRKLPSWKPEAPIHTWLYAITVRLAQQHRRRARRWSWFRARAGRAGEHADWLARLTVGLAGTRDPQAELEGRQTAQTLYRVLADLPDTHRTALILFELKGLTAEEIAAVTGTSVANVWARLSRGRRAFIRRYEALRDEGSAR
jgi:RNA polymerase sigma-70 factor, ECF subfamily